MALLAGAAVVATALAYFLPIFQVGGFVYTMIDSFSGGRRQFVTSIVLPILLGTVALAARRSWPATGAAGCPRRGRDGLADAGRARRRSGMAKEHPERHGAPFEFRIWVRRRVRGDRPRCDRVHRVGRRVARRAAVGARVDQRVDVVCGRRRRSVCSLRRRSVRGIECGTALAAAAMAASRPLVGARGDHGALRIGHLASHAGIPRSRCGRVPCGRRQRRLMASRHLDRGETIRRCRRPSGWSGYTIMAVALGAALARSLHSDSVVRRA